MELVSILVRTCERPQILREALESIRKQTYPAIEVIVVEDGRNTAQNMVETEFKDLNLKYKCTGERKGRVAAGNLAMSMASGSYLNFLDDDDYLLPEHVETLMHALEKSQNKAAYAVAYESIVEYDKKHAKYKEYKRWVRYRQPFNRVYLTFNNYIPIQSILFSRTLYEKLGGFDEQMDFLEDWEMWVRYSTETDFLFVNRETSVYRVPKKKVKRDTGMYQAYQQTVEKFKKYERPQTYYEISKELEYILEEVKTPGWKRGLKKIRDRVLYKDGEQK